MREGRVRHRAGETVPRDRFGPIVVPTSAVRRSTRHELVDLRKFGFIPGVSGGARGFNQQGDVVTQTADGRDLNQIWGDFQAALAMYNADRDRLFGAITFGVTQPIEDVFQGGDTVDFEEASEFGVPVGIRAALPTYFSLGYLFKWYDLAVRYTMMFLAEATTQQVDSLNNSAVEADNRLMFDKVMKQIFNNVTRVATIQGNNFNVYPIYNGDTVVPPRYKTTVHTAPHTHFLVSGGATVDPGDLADIENHLKHHGYGWREGTTLVLLANSAQVNTIRTFRVATGAAYDFIAAQGAPPWALTEADLLANAGAAPPSQFRGLPVEGRYGPWMVIEDDLIPAGYLVGLASGGDNDARNLVGVREHAQSGLRGLRLVKGPDNDYPLIDSYYLRGFGTGIRQRGAGVVMQIKASGTYDVPSAYA